MDESSWLSNLTGDMSLLDEFEPDPTTCTCSGSCWYKTGKASCPCKSAGYLCRPQCKCGRKKPCSNRAPDSSDSSSDDEGEPFPKIPRKTTAQSKEDRHLENVKKLVTDLQRNNLEKVAIMCLTRFPDCYLDVVASLEATPMEPANEEDPPSPAPPEPANEEDPPSPAPPEPAHPAAPWCVCGRCQHMPSEVENVCCRIHTCVTTEQHYADVVINANVLATCMAASNDNFPRDIPRTNESYRHYAYKQYIYMHHGHLGAGNRRVVPSCAVCRVREVYPSPTNQYKGFSNGMHD